MADRRKTPGFLLAAAALWAGLGACSTPQGPAPGRVAPRAVDRLPAWLTTGPTGGTAEPAEAPAPEASAPEAGAEEPPALPPCEGAAKGATKSAGLESPFDFYFDDGACARLRYDDPDPQLGAIVQVRSQGVLETRGVKVARIVIESSEQLIAGRLPMYVPRFVWRDAKRVGMVFVDEDDLPNDPSVLEGIAREAERKKLPSLGLPIAEVPFTKRGGIFRRWVRDGQARLFCTGEIRGLRAWCADECSSTVCYDPRGGVAFLGDAAGYPRGDFVREGATLPLDELRDPWAGKRPND
jgi:hypothetical protein